MQGRLLAAILGLATTMCLSHWSASGGSSPANARAETMIGLPVNDLSVRDMGAKQLVFSEEQDWLSFWNGHSQAPAPLVDFSRWRIAAVLLGPRPNPGYGVRFKSATVSEGRIALDFVELLPDPNLMYAQMIVYPFDVVAIPVGQPVDFIKEVRQRGKPRPAEQVQSRVLDTAGLSPPAEQQYVLFADADPFAAFWRSHSKSSTPQVDLQQTLVAGLLLPETAPEVRLVRVEQTGDEVRVKMARGAMGPGRKSLLVVVPRAKRVDFGWDQSPF